MDKFRKRLENIRKPKVPRAPKPAKTQKKIPKLSLCTTCKGREHHLEKTIPHNIRLVREFDLEWIILDYDSPGDLRSLTAKYPEITYIRIDNKPVFHMSNAKNLAHKAATGAVLLNVDADNFLSEEIITDIIESFEKNENIICSHDKKHVRGFIAISRNNFDMINGYNEKFTGWGYEDRELIIRAENNDISWKKINKVKRIKHDDDERTKFFEISKKRSEKINSKLFRSLL